MGNTVPRDWRIMTQAKEEIQQNPSQSRGDEVTEDEIDRNLMGTFPASDPPSWTLGIARDNPAEASAEVVASPENPLPTDK